MQWLKNWVQDLVILVIFISIIEMLLPGGALKKYVKIVLGFFVLLTVLNPILALVKSDLNLGYPFNNLPGQQTTPLSDEKATGEALAKTNEKLALDAFENQVAQQIRAVILTQEEIQDATVQVEAAGQGEIKTVQIGLRISEPENSVVKKVVATNAHSKKSSPAPDSINVANSTEPIREVQPVSIMVGEGNTSTAKNSQANPEITQKLQAKVVKLITGFYNVKSEVISFK